MHERDIRELSISHLIPRMCHLHHEQASTHFRSMGLYRAQGSVLMQLWAQDGKTPTELGSHRGVKPSTITKTLQRMEKEGWLVRRKDPHDRRVTRVFLTDKGRQAEDRVEEINNDLELLLLTGLNVEERLLLRRLLIQVIENLQEGESD